MSARERKVMCVWTRTTSQEGPGGCGADEDERWVDKKSRVVKDN